MRLVLFLLAASIAWPQSAIFPGAVATDQNLLKAKRVSTGALSASISNSTLTAPVIDGTQFVAFELIRIDNEEMVVCSIASNTLTLCSGSRGWDGTTAASHLIGAAVRGVISATHHNQMAAEVKAIETRFALYNALTGCVGVNAGIPSARTIQPGTGISVFQGNCVGDPAIGIDATVQTKAIDQAGTVKYCRSTTGNDSYTCTLTPTLTAYTRGGCFVLDANASNTGTATLAIDGLNGGVGLSILNRAGSALATGDITANKPITVCHDGTQFIIQGDGGGGGGGTGDALISTVQSDGYRRCVAANASTTYTCTMTPTLLSYTDGMTVSFRQTGNSSGSGASTLSIDGIGNRAIKWTRSTVADTDPGSGGSCYPLQNTDVRLVYKSSVSAFVMTDCSGVHTYGRAADAIGIPLNAYDLCDLSGSNPTFTCTVPNVSSISAAMHIQIYSGTALTAAFTINVSSTSARDVVQPDGTSNPSASCPIPAQVPVLAVFDNVSGKWRMASCAAAGSGGAATSIATSPVGSLPGTSVEGDIRYATGATMSSGGLPLYINRVTSNTWEQLGYVAGGNGTLTSSCTTLPCVIDTTAAVPTIPGTNNYSGVQNNSGTSKSVPPTVGTNAARPSSGCSPGQQYHQTDGTAGLYTNMGAGTTCTWLLLGSGGSTPTALSDAGEMKINENYCAGTSSIFSNFVLDSGSGGVTTTWTTSARRPGCGINIIASNTSGNDGSIITPSGITGLDSTTNWEYVTVMELPAITNLQASAGFSDAAGKGSSDPATNNGIFVYFNPAVDAHWRFVTCKAFTCTATPLTSTITVAANTKYIIRIRSTTAGTVLFSVNGETEQSLSASANMPTADLRMFGGYVKTTATATATIHIWKTNFLWTGL